MSPERFLFRWASAYRRAAAPFGVHPGNAVAVLDADGLDVRFGPWRLRTPRENITGAEITGPYRFYRTAGPARLAVSDRGLTFATNGERGVLVHFATPVRGIEPTGLLSHPELTLTVADLERFLSALGGPATR